MSKLLEQINIEKRTPLVLSDYIKIKHGFAFKGEYFSNQPTPDVLVTPGNFAIGGGFKADKFKYYKGSVPEDYILKENDLVVTMTDLSVDADTLGYSALIPHDDKNRFLHNQRVGLIQKKKEGIDFGYLYYLMRTRPYQKYVVSTASGSTVKHTSPDRIASYEYNFPTPSTQKKIAEILSAYDSKIENNNSIIKNLEATAQTIFNEWFINFGFPGHEKVKMVDSEMGKIPEGWNVLNIKDLFDIKYGKNLPTSKISVAGLYPVYGAGGIIGFYSEKNSDGKNILITCRGNGSGTIWRTRESGFITNNSFIIKPKSDFNHVNFVTIYFILNKSNIASSVSGSAQPQITIEGINSVKVLLPEKNILNSFQNKTTQFFNLIDDLYRQNEKLKQSRDQLLAKLI